MLQSMGSHRVGHKLATEQQQVIQTTTSMAEQNLRSWSVDTSPPSPQVAGLSA